MTSGLVSSRWLVPAGLVAVLVAADAGGTGINGFVALVLLTLTVATVLLPDSGVALALVGLAGAAWLGATHASASPWTLVASGGLFAIHVGAAHTAQGPARTPGDAVTRRRWIVRSAAVMTGAGAVWAVAAVLGDADQSVDPALAVLALGALAAAGGLVATRVTNP